MKQEFDVSSIVLVDFPRHCSMSAERGFHPPTADVRDFPDYARDGG